MGYFPRSSILKVLGYSLIRTVELNMESTARDIKWELGHLLLEFRLQIPSVVLEIRFRPMYTMSGLKRERGLSETVTEPVSSSPAVYTPFFALLCLCFATTELEEATPSAIGLSKGLG